AAGAEAEAVAPASVPPLEIETARPGAPDIVALPDFTLLVERTGPAVVNIEASLGLGRDNRGDRADRGRTSPEELDPFGDDEKAIGGNPNSPGRQSPDENVPEFFRRFFEDQPGMPVIPRGGVSQGTGFI